MHNSSWLRWLIEPVLHAKPIEDSSLVQLRQDLEKLLDNLNDLDRDLRTRFSYNRIETDSRILRLSFTRTVVLEKIIVLRAKLKMRQNRFSGRENGSDLDS